MKVAQSNTWVSAQGISLKLTSSWLCLQVQVTGPLFLPLFFLLVWSLQSTQNRTMSFLKLLSGVLLVQAWLFQHLDPFQGEMSYLMTQIFHRDRNEHGACLSVHGVWSLQPSKATALPTNLLQMWGQHISWSFCQLAFLFLFFFHFFLTKCSIISTQAVSCSSWKTIKHWSAGILGCVDCSLSLETACSAAVCA